MGSIYVGSTKNVEQRKKYYSSIRCKSQPKIYNSIKKYGWDNHTFEILEECDEQHRLILERAWGDFYNVLGRKNLNCVLPANNEYPKVFSEETLEKMSISAKKNIISKETRVKMANSLRNKKKKPHTEETKLKMSLSALNMDKNKRDYINKSKFGVKKSKSFCEEVSKRLMKKVINVETGETYESIKEASLYTAYTQNNLSRMLSGKRKNKTNLKIYIKDENF